jgi:hypothetical protein
LNDPGTPPDNSADSENFDSKEAPKEQKIELKDLRVTVDKAEVGIILFALF